jgi:hypothetical protein
MGSQVLWIFAITNLSVLVTVIAFRIARARGALLRTRRQRSRERDPRRWS